VRCDRVPAPAGDAFDRGLEALVREGLDLAAVVAHEVVVMIAVDMGRLETRHAVAQVDPLDESECVHSLERPVDARDPDLPATSPERLVDLLCREAAVLLAEELDDQPPRAPAATARVTEATQGHIGPRDRHSDNDTRSQRRATVGVVRLLVSLLVLLSVLAVTVGCSRGEVATSERPVVASFYPLAWAIEQLVSDARGDVVNLTPPGAEPHDVELAPSDVETIRDAKLVVYLSGGFQPAVEDAVAERDGPSLDVLGGDPDPHIWLDPIRFGRAVEQIARAVGASDSADDELRAALKQLDREYRRSLSDCDRRTLVTTHAAFGRLAARYGLSQLSLAGRSPESEPSPRKLEDLIAKVRESATTTVFVEPLVSDRLARTVAREAGAEVETLDPIEGLSQDRLAAGDDYLTIMRSNLAALRKALGCR
jgi:zinc transport system substrate-binding protein